MAGKLTHLTLRQTGFMQSLLDYHYWHASNYPWIFISLPISQQLADALVEKNVAWHDVISESYFATVENRGDGQLSDMQLMPYLLLVDCVRKDRILVKGIAFSDLENLAGQLTRILRVEQIVSYRLLERCNAGFTLRGMIILQKNAGSNGFNIYQKIMFEVGLMLKNMQDESASVKGLA